MTILLSLNNKLQLLQLVLLLVHHHFQVNLLARESSEYCDAAISCANLGSNIPYPFASSPSCAPLSSSFLLSNCSSQQAYWDAFTKTIPPNDISTGIIGPPKVMGLFRDNSSTYINLAWDSNLISQPCTPLPAKNFSHTIPSSIDLTFLAPHSTVRFSTNNVYLLLNCVNSSSADLDQLMRLPFVYLEADTAWCQSYRAQCSLLAEYTQCVQLFLFTFPPTQLSLQKAIISLGCTHFQFFVTKNDANDVAMITEWSKGIVQLQWTDTKCLNCLVQEYSGLSCVFDSTNRTFEHCNCKHGVADSSGKCFPSYIECGGRFSICHNRVKIGVSVVVIVGTLLGLLALVCWRRVRRRRSMKLVENLTKFPRMSAWPLARQESSGSNDHEPLNDLDLNGLSERPMEYSYSSIASSTNSFSSIVGEGGFGVVYKGAFSTDDQTGPVQEIAVKVLEVRSKHSKKQFLNEVAIIGRIHHVNVVRLLGFCVQQEEHEMLVYEYVANGSLDTWLFMSSKRPRGVDALEKELEWGHRYEIALGVARGLSYLHEECRHRIVHCDIKPQNILLDASMCPKIADFGLAKLMSRDESRVVTLAKGTPGYMAPEFWVGGDIHLTTKADVYSFGMVLLELVSGRRNFAFGCRRFPTVAFEAAMRGDFESIIDIRLHAGIFEADDGEKRFLMLQQVRTTIFVALWCIQEHPTSRPCMSDVVQYLTGIAAVSEQPPLPAIASTSATTRPPPQIALDSSSCSYLQDFTPPPQIGR